MKRASYREAVAWIALNDGNGDVDRLDARDIVGMISIALIADIFDVPQIKVATDVVLYRANVDQNKKASGA